MVAPGLPSFFADGMMALPPPTASRNGAAAEEVAQLLARLDQLLEILDVASREGVLDHRDGSDLLDGPGDFLAAVFVDLLHDRQHLSDFHASGLLQRVRVP